MPNNVSTPPQVPHLAHLPSSRSNLGNPDHEFVIIEDVSPRHTEMNGTLISRFGKSLSDNKAWLVPMLVSTGTSFAVVMFERLVAESSADTPTDGKDSASEHEVAGRENQRNASPGQDDVTEACQSALPPAVLGQEN